MGENRSQRHLDGLLRQEEVDYFHNFALGELALSPTGKSIDLQISGLRQLVVIPGQEKPSDPSPEKLSTERLSLRAHDDSPRNVPAGTCSRPLIKLLDQFEGALLESSLSP